MPISTVKKLPAPRKYAPVYCFDEITGAYQREDKAVIDPKGGRVMAPAFSTTATPPKFTPESNTVAVYLDDKGKVARNDGQGRWRVVANYVGQTYWLPDGTAIIIDELGVKPTEGSLLEPPPTAYHTTHDGTRWILDVNAARADMVESINEKADILAAQLRGAMSAVEREIQLKMELEAYTFTNNKKAATPLIDQRVKGSGMTKAEYVEDLLAGSALIDQQKADIVEKQNALIAVLDALLPSAGDPLDVQMAALNKIADGIRPPLT